MYKYTVRKALETLRLFTSSITSSFYKPTLFSRPTIMQFTTIFTTFAVAFFAPLVLFAQLITAMPVAETSLENRDVYTPPILIPNADTVWNIGERQNVTW